jgi:hypothetical protein
VVNIGIWGGRRYRIAGADQRIIERQQFGGEEKGRRSEQGNGGSIEIFKSKEGKKKDNVSVRTVLGMGAPFLNTSAMVGGYQHVCSSTAADASMMESRIKGWEKEGSSHFVLREGERKFSRGFVVLK